MYRPGDDKHLHSRSELFDRIVALLAGRAAEEEALGEVSSGAADDLERATSMARRMVAVLGMSAAIGPVNLGGGPAATMMAPPGKQVSERTAIEVDAAVRKLILDAYQMALRTVREHREALERVANALVELETLDSDQLEDFIAGSIDVPVAPGI